MDPRTKFLLVLDYAVLVVASSRLPSLAAELAVLIGFILDRKSTRLNSSHYS